MNRWREWLGRITRLEVLAVVSLEVTDNVVIYVQMVDKVVNHNR